MDVSGQPVGPKLKGQADQEERSYAGNRVESDWFSQMEPIGCPETSVINYQSTLR
jgi:hypothetical protein